MKKFIPYILIVAMIGTFAWLSFASSNKVSAQTQEQENIGAWTWFKDNFGVEAWKAVGKGVYERPARLFPGVAVVETYWGDWGKIADATIGQMVAWISNFTWYVSSKIFTLSAFLLDYAVDFSVKDFKENIDQISVINTGYKIVLNVANMLFIFILLYIAIKTILGMGGDTKKLLTNIIVVGLFINFSLFMTKTIIDASNIVAMGFYNAVQTEVGQTKIEGDGKQQKMISIGSVSTAMMAGLKLQTQIPSTDSEYNKTDSSKGLTNFNIAMNQFGGSALFLVSAFVFLSVAILFIVRFVALLFYMLFSPVAFLGLIFPEMKEYSTKWWSGLQSQALFAPAFLFMVYLISSIINSGQLWRAVGGEGNESATFYDAFSSSGPEGFPIIMNYVILMALMIGALITAKEMAGKGSAGVLQYTNKFQGWAQGVAGRNTLGRAAYLAGNNKYMAKLMAKSPTLGNFAKTQFDNVAGQKFGSKIGYTEALKKSVDKKKKMGEFVGKYSSKETDESIRKEERLLDEKNELARRHAKESNDLRMEHRRLADIASRTKVAADLDAAQSAFERLRREETLLENVERDIVKTKRNIHNLKSAQKNIGSRSKREYARNVEFDSSILNKMFPSGADAAAEIRRGKKSAKQLVEEVLKETGELPKKEEGAEEKKEEKKEEKS